MKCDIVLFFLINDFLIDFWCIFEIKLVICYKKNIIVKLLWDVNIYRDLLLFLKYMFWIDI